MLKITEEVAQNVTSSNNLKYHITDQDIFVVSNGLRKRKLYYNLQYTEQQNKWIAEIRQALEKQPNIHVKDKQTLLRYYYSSDMDIQKCIAKLQKYSDWFNNKEIQSITNQTNQIYQKDVLYSYGYAKDGKPFIIMNGGKVDMDKYKAMSYYQAMNYINNKVINQKFIPGYVETYHYILDLQQKLMGLPVTSLREIIDIISNAYSMRLQSLKLVNCTFATKLIYKSLSTFISEETKLKIQLFTKEDLNNGLLLEYFDAAVLQRKYGGTHRNIDHRNMTINEQTPLNRDMSEDSQFYTIYDNQEEYGHYYQQQGICCTASDCAIY